MRSVLSISDRAAIERARKAVGFALATQKRLLKSTASRSKTVVSQKDTLSYMPTKKTKDKPDTKTIRFASDLDLLTALEEEAKREGRTFSQQVKYILRKHLDRKTK